jgi:hypothetical protein
MGCSPQPSRKFTMQQEQLATIHESVKSIAVQIAVSTGARSGLIFVSCCLFLLAISGPDIPRVPAPQRQGVPATRPQVCDAARAARNNTGESKEHHGPIRGAYFLAAADHGVADCCCKGAQSGSSLVFLMVFRACN